MCIRRSRSHKFSLRSGRADRPRRAAANGTRGWPPGVLVAVHDPKRGDFVSAYGTAGLATGQPMDAADHVRIGSISKTFTATAVLRAADEGKLALDDVLERYVPGVPNGTSITLRDLLGMQGGVWDVRRDPAFLANYGEPTARSSGTTSQIEWTGTENSLVLAYRDPSVRIIVRLNPRITTIMREVESARRKRNVERD
ncbi:serine hydrolase domain-containing protein [Nocardia sp. NPDC057455]|uniref:serine hydrolase domain-containing protein n=1 Tax=Nocardia sp. NPDC057455 TaxID=3346138 RepID=UPI0036734B25